MDKITSALAAGSGALQLIKKLRSLDEGILSNLGNRAKALGGRAKNYALDKAENVYDRASKLGSDIKREANIWSKAKEHEFARRGKRIDDNEGRITQTMKDDGIRKGIGMFRDINRDEKDKTRRVLSTLHAKHNIPRPIYNTKERIKGLFKHG